MAKWRLEAGAEVDLLSGDEMKDLLTPQEELLLGIRDVLLSQADKEKLVAVGTFLLSSPSTGASVTFAARIFRAPTGFGAEVHSIALWTPSSLAGFTGTSVRTLGPAALVINSPTGPVAAVFGGTGASAIGWTFGRAQSPLLRDGETLWAIGKISGAISNPENGLVRVQHTLAPTTIA